MKRLLILLIFGLVWLAGSAASQAQEPAAGSVQQTSAVESSFGKAKVSGSGDLSSDTQELTLRLQVRNLFDSPLFLAGRGRVGQQRLIHYDLHRWGWEVGAGWALNPTTDLLATYRLDNTSLFNVSPDADPAYRDVAGLSNVGALGLGLQNDKRDDPHYATTGHRAKLSGELAVRGWGGDYNFGRLESDFATYTTPFRERAAGTLWEDLTFVEHLRLGWMENFGSTDEVPFFERYFVGGASTVRGHRGDWLSTRDVDDQFVGGEIEMINNVEARLPIFKGTFHRRLSTAAFFDVGRAYRRFSDVGDFGYGAGMGLRYVVHFWEIHGVLRADFGVNLNREDDDSSSRFHITFGSPF